MKENYVLVGFHDDISYYYILLTISRIDSYVIIVIDCKLLEQDHT